MASLIELIVSIMVISIVYSSLTKKGNKGQWSEIKKRLQELQQESMKAEKGISTFRQESFSDAPLPEETESKPISPAFVSMEDVTRDDFFSRSRIVHQEEESSSSATQSKWKPGAKDFPVQSKETWLPGSLQQPEALMNAIIMSEVLAKPKAFRQKR